MELTTYCFFTVEHSQAKRVYIRGVADITEPIDDYDKIIKFSHGHEMKSELPPNPFEKGTDEHSLYNELVSSIQSDFESFGDELVFVTDDKKYEYLNHKRYDFYNLDMEKVII